VTVAPGSNPAKRVLELAANPANRDEVYGAIEVGGVIRSLDAGEHWENVSHGQYLNDDTVDMHGVLVARWRPGTVFAIGRAGLFSSTDRGGHWASARLEPLNPKGQTYCRDIREVPGDPKTIWVAAGASFRSEVGALFRSNDGGLGWTRVEMGVKPKTTMFAVAFDERQPGRMFCATSGGEVSRQRGWRRGMSGTPCPPGPRSVLHGVRVSKWIEARDRTHLGQIPDRARPAGVRRRRLRRAAGLRQAPCAGDRRRQLFLLRRPAGAPILESIKRWRNSCGEDAWPAIEVIKGLLGAARGRGVPVIYTTGNARPDLWNRGSWRWKNSRRARTRRSSARAATSRAIRSFPTSSRPQDIVLYKDKPERVLRSPQSPTSCSSTATA
jgi:hypothetical protein